MLGNTTGMIHRRLRSSMLDRDSGSGALRCRVDLGCLPCLPMSLVLFIRMRYGVSLTAG